MPERPTVPVTVCIPTIPPREHLLARALASVEAQTVAPEAVVVERDEQGVGAALTRHRALEQAETEWVAFLDDDDEFLPHHLERCLGFAEEGEWDLVFPWFTVVGGSDPFPHWFRVPFDPTVPRVVPVTTLARTEAVLEVGGFADYLEVPDPVKGGEDSYLVRKMAKGGWRIGHLGERTWVWHHDSGNTSGRADRWVPQWEHRQRKERMRGRR